MTSPTAPTAPPTPTTVVPRGRVVGVDLARCLALVGMMATHIAPSVEDGRVTPLFALAAGRSSALFAVLAGVSLALLHGRREPVRGRAWRGAAAGLVARAVLVGLVGLLLGGLDTGIAVILVSYAVLFVLGAPFLALRAGPALALGAAWLVVTPLASHALRAHLPPPSYDVPAFDSLLDPGRLLAELLLTGYYPAVVWLGYLLVGLGVGRLDLTRRTTLLALGSAGAVLAAAATVLSDRLTADPVVRSVLRRTCEGAGCRDTLDLTLTEGMYGVTPTGSDWWLAVRTPHSGTPFDLLATTGSALLVLALCVAVGLAAPRVVAVLGGAGAMTLTLYALHVVSRQDGLWDAHTAGTWLAQVVVALLVGAGFRLARRRGPLEAFVGEVSGEVRRAVAGRSAAPDASVGSGP